MTDDREISAKFVLAGQLEAGDIAHLDIPGGRFARPADPARMGVLGTPVGSRWEVSSRAAGSASLGEHVQDILDQLRGREAQLLALAQHYQAYVACVVYLREAQAPECMLTPQMVSGVAALGAGLDVDIYCLTGNSGKDDT